MKVRIYQPSKTTMQSGRRKTKAWILEYELPSKRAPEPLMGWTASEDTLNQVRLKFATKEEAVAFAGKKGWVCDVAEPHERRVTPRNYVDNFRYIPPEEPPAEKKG
jgi:hypothetical protein